MEFSTNYIEELAQSGANKTFYTSNTKDAAKVLKQIFENSKQIVRIYAGALSGELSQEEDYICGLEDLLKRGVVLKVLLQDSQLKRSTHSRILDLLGYWSILHEEQIQLRTHQYQVLQNDVEIHFTIGDDRMYRIEVDINSFSAQNNFNDAEECKQWIQQFDEIFVDAKEPEHYFS